MHDGFIRFWDASLGTWKSSNGYVTVSRGTPEDVELISSLHLDLGIPLACFKMTWGYKNAKKTGSASILAVSEKFPDMLFNSGMAVAMPKRYEQYIAPLQLHYAVTENDRKLEWWTDDLVVRDRAEFVGPNERVRTFILGSMEKETHEVRENEA